MSFDCRRIEDWLNEKPNRVLQVYAGKMTFITELVEDNKVVLSSEEAYVSEALGDLFARQELIKKLYAERDGA